MAWKWAVRVGVAMPPVPLRGGAGEGGGLGVAAGDGGLVAQGVQDARAQQPVAGGLGQGEGLHVVALGQRAGRGAVVGHPRGQPRGVADGGEQGAADSVGVLAVEHPVGVGAQVLDQGLPSVAATEPMVKLGEHFCRRAESLDVGQADLHALGWFLGHLAGVGEPAE
jgi:hypothetical protein